MLKYIRRRILMMIPVIIGITFIIFLIMELSPGDPARLVLGIYASQEDVEELRVEMGLNDNFFVRYGRFVISMAKLDLGRSWNTGYDVSSELASRIPCTVKLAVGAMLIIVAIGIPVGIISAVKQYSFIDLCSLSITLLLTSMPVFWFGLLLILLFSLKLNILPATGIESWKNFILPCITMAATQMAVLIRMTRSTMLEVIRQDYIRTARAKGVSERVVILKHALRNAMMPIITIIGLNFGVLMGGALVTESVFAMPGIGLLLITSVRAKDIPMVMANVLFIAIMVSIINLIVDILYFYIDPRLKTQYLKG